MTELDAAFDALVSDLGGTVVGTVSDEDLIFAEPLVGPGLRSPELTGFDKSEVLNLVALASERARMFGDTPPTEKQQEFLADLVVKAKDESYLSTLRWSKYELPKSECSAWIDTYLKSKSA